MKIKLLVNRNIWPLKCKAGETVEVEESIGIRWVAEKIAIEVKTDENNKKQNKEGK